MGDPFDSIVAACNLPSSQQRLLDESLYAREDEEDEPSPIHNPPLFSSADRNTIVTSSPPAEEFVTPPEDPRRPIETDLDPIPVEEKRISENRSPIEEAPPPAKKARVSESSSSLQTEEIDDDYDNCDTEEIEDYDEDDGEANAERTDGDVDMLMEVLALLAREELQHRCHESVTVDIFETAKRRW